MASPISSRRFGITGDKGIKAPVRAATSSNITLSGEQTSGGVAIVSGDRVLVWQQTNSVQNGIYDASTGAWTRSIDANGSQDLVTGTGVFVTTGTYALQFFSITTSSTIQPDTTSITFLPAVQQPTALAAPSGSSLFGFIQSGSGAVSRTGQSKLRDIVSVKDFGAVGDGITDDTAAINAAIASVLNGGSVYFPRGVYKATTTIYVPYGVILFGCGVQHTPNILALTAQGSVIYGVHTGAAVVSFKGAYNGGLQDLIIIGDSVTTPKTMLCLGRSSAASAGRHYFKNINVVGYCTKAGAYSIASEENMWSGIRINVLGGGAQYAFLTAETDSLSVDSMTGGSNFTMNMNGFNILNQADYTGLSKPTFAIFVQAGVATQALSFQGGFTGMTSQCTDSSHIRVELTATTLGDIAFRDIGCESSNSANPPLQNIYLGGAGFVLPGFVADNVSGGQFESGQTYHIKAQGGLELNAPYIHCSKTNHPTSLSIIRGGTVNVNDQDLHIDYISEGCNYFARQLYLIETAGGDKKNNIALCPVFIGPIAFGGGAVNDMSINSTSIFTGTVTRAMVVYIDASTTPNTFKWSNDGGGTWIATGVAITGGVQTLSEGIAIKFVATTGHATGSQWSWTAQPNAQFI